MSLETKFVEVNLTSKVIKHYESLGYEIPKYKDINYIERVKIGTKIIVKVEDLPETSLVKVDVKCDYCGKIHSKAYGKYKSERKVIEKDACFDCCHLKQQEVFIFKYGVNAAVQVEEFKQKIVAKTRNFSNIKDLQKEFQSKNCLLISKEYVNQSQQLEYICLKHSDMGIQKVTYANFKKDKFCQYCRNEKIGNALRHSLEFIIEQFDKINCDVLITEYKNGHELIPYRCRKHPKHIQFVTYSNMFTHNVGCKFCRIEKKIKNDNYKIPESDLFKYLRTKLNTWKKDSMKICNYKCALTGKKFNDIHHLFPFHKIVYKTLDNLSLPLCEKIEQYTNEELANIVDECLRLHFELGYGICLAGDVHSLFHQIFGYSNTDENDFEEFKQRYYNFELDGLLDDKYKYVNVQNKVS